MKRVFGLLLFVGGVSIIYFMQSSTGGLPGCGAYDTRNMLAGIARDVLTKSNVGYSRIDIAQATAVPADTDGVIQCTAQLVIDGDNDKIEFQPRTPEMSSSPRSGLLRQSRRIG